VVFRAHTVSTFCIAGACSRGNGRIESIQRASAGSVYAPSQPQRSSPYDIQSVGFCIPGACLDCLQATKRTLRSFKLLVLRACDGSAGHCRRAHLQKKLRLLSVEYAASGSSQYPL
jgi:hypothetical protein